MSDSLIKSRFKDEASSKQMSHIIPANFHFLILETCKQLDAALENLEEPESGRYKKARDRDDYIDLLKARIEIQCYREVRDASHLSKRNLAHLVARNVITSNLERIADYCVNLCKQSLFLKNKRLPRGFRSLEMFSEIRRGLNKVEHALLHLDVDAAMEIARTESRLDKSFTKGLEKISQRLKTSKAPQDLLTMLFILRYLERMGDCLQNIGEAILSAAVGERVKLGQMEALEENLQATGHDVNLAGLDLRTFSETKSGCVTSSVGQAEEAPTAIFKEGRLQKLEQEYLGLKHWKRIRPGLVPEVLEFRPNGSKASLLVEYISGRTLQAHFLNDPDTLGREGLMALLNLLPVLWKETATATASTPRFLTQLKRRMGDVRRLHPRLARHRQYIAGVTVPALGDLLARLAVLDHQIASPVSVVTHGDLNLDNVLYNEQRGSLHYLDVHRARLQDYLQDLSVLMVSIYRQPLQDRRWKKQVSQLTRMCYKTGREFADENGDHGFEARLALGIARSCITSTRFVVEAKQAKNMFLRGVFLLEKLANCPQPERDFQFPLWILKG